MNDGKKKKEKLNGLSKGLLLVAAFTFCFVIATMIIYTIKDWQFDTLITCVLSGAGADAVISGFIQISKYFTIRRNKKDDTGTDNETD